MLVNDDQQTMKRWNEKYHISSKKFESAKCAPGRFNEFLGAFLAWKVYEEAGEAKALQQLIQPIESKMKWFDSNFWKGLMQKSNRPVK